MNRHTTKSSDTSDRRLVKTDRTPTSVDLEGGQKWQPGKDRITVDHYSDGSIDYKYDGKSVKPSEVYGALVGRDTIPASIKAFGGIGEGTLRKAWESDEEWRLRNG